MLAIAALLAGLNGGPIATAASSSGPDLSRRAAALADGDDVVLNVDDAETTKRTTIFASTATCNWVAEPQIAVIDGVERDVGLFEVLTCTTDGNPLSPRAAAAAAGRRRRGTSSTEDNYNIVSSMVAYSTPLRSPIIVTNPAGPRPLLVGLPTWFSLAATPTRLTGMTVRINDVAGGSYVVTEVAEPVETVWQVGSGKAVRCGLVLAAAPASALSRTTSCSITPQRAGGQVAVLGGIRYRRRIVDPFADRFSPRALPGAIAVRAEVRCVMELQQVARSRSGPATCR